MKHDNSISRRAFLGGNIAFAMGCAAAHNRTAAMRGEERSTHGPSIPSQIAAELYAFRGEAADSPAIAVTWPVHFDARILRLHVGHRNLYFELENDDRADVSARREGLRTFLGPIGAHPGELRALVIEAPHAALADDAAIDIWAELVTPDARSRRIGSPLMAPSLAADRALLDLHSLLSPAQDRPFLMDPLARAIARQARQAGRVDDPESHGRRLASILLPDVLRYDPTLPAGFTFAARNGRHPLEASNVVVDAMLMAAPSMLTTPTHERISATFPYFSVASPDRRG